MFRYLLLAMLCFTALAHASMMIERAPLLQVSEYPTPPRQDASWDHDSTDAWAVAVATIFSQGLPDPRALPYHEIAVGRGDTFSMTNGQVVTIHGWLLPTTMAGDRFAIAWNGLIYPVVRIGPVADLATDWAPPAKGRWKRGLSLLLTERDGMYPAAGIALHYAYLERLGHQGLLAQVLEQRQVDPASLTYLHLATDWGWSTYLRGVNGFARGDHRLATLELTALQQRLPLINAEATRLGASLPQQAPGARQPTYLPQINQLEWILADMQRRSERSAPDPTNELLEQIADLENLRLWNERDLTVGAPDKRRTLALVRQGDVSVDLLIKTMARDRRLTRSVSSGDRASQYRRVIPAAEIAHRALAEILLADFDTAAEYQAFWQHARSLSPEERLYRILATDSASPAKWLQVAERLLRPDIDGVGVPPKARYRREPPAMRYGDVLRDGRDPSVAALMAARSDQIARDPRGSPVDRYFDACQMALYLAEWEPDAALPVLRRRLLRAWSIGLHPHDPLLPERGPKSVGISIVDTYGDLIVDLTMARAVCGEPEAYDRYALWLRRFEIGHVTLKVLKLMKPLIAGIDRRTVRETLDLFFNDPRRESASPFVDHHRLDVNFLYMTPIVMTDAFRKQAARGFADRREAGTFRITSLENQELSGPGVFRTAGWALTMSQIHDDYPLPAPGESWSFRVCDAYAYFYFREQDGPEIQLHWPEAKRDEAVEACRVWLAGRPVFGGAD